MTDPRARRALGAVLAAFMLVPPAVAVVTMWGRHWYPVSDLAIFDMSVRDVFSAHPPLTGLWSRPGWSHPGPLAYWVVALFSAPLGAPAWATRVGTALMEGVALGALAWITWRRGLRLMLAASAVTGMTYLATGPWIFRQPWNVHIPLPFFLLFLFLVVVIAEGSTRLFIAMAFVGSMIVQTHVGYTALVATGFVWAIGWTIVDARRTGRPPDRWRSTAGWSVAVLTVVWLPPVIDLVVYPPGNLHGLVGYFTAGTYSHVGLGRAAGIFADEFRFVPPMLGGRDHLAAFSGFAQPAAVLWLVVPAVMLAAGFVAARSTRRREDLRRLALASVLIVVAVVAISRADEPRSYTFQWRVVVAGFAVVSSIWAVERAIDRSIPRTVRMLGVATVVSIAAWGAIAPNIEPTSDTRGPPEIREQASRQIMETVRRHHLERDHTILVRATLNSDQLYGGIVDELDRDGIDVRVPRDQGRIYGGHRVGREASADEVWVVTDKGSKLPALLAVPGARLIASTSPLPRAQDAELARLQTEVGAQLDRAGQGRKRQFLDADLFPFTVVDVPGVNHLAATRIGALNRAVSRAGGCRCAIVAAPGGRAAPQH